VKLGCVMPGESPAVFGDALRRLAAAATYLYQDGPRYWYSTQPTVTKLAEDRAEQLKRNAGLHLNRRLRSQGIHDLDAVIVALKSWTTALLSWTSFALNFVIRNPHRRSSLPRMQRFLRMIVAEGELTSDRPERSTIFHFHLG
jgi:hypothetical protein